jgi:hypothetical protein
VHRIIVLNEGVRSSTHGIEISRYLGCLLELITAQESSILKKVDEPHAIILLKDPFSVKQCIFIPGILAIGNNSPIIWAYDAQAHLGLETWLVEAREHTEAVEGFEL